MGEVVNVLVAFAVIVFIFRWATSTTEASAERRSAADTLGFRPKPVTQLMIDTVSNMFPDIPVDNVRYDLLRTGNVEVTSNKILERGFLDPPPPAYYTLFPRDGGNAANIQPAALAAAPETWQKKQPESLISRYELQDRIATSDAVVSDDQIGGKATWEDSAEKREASLRERKAQMVLAARQRLLAQQQKSNSES